MAQRANISQSNESINSVVVRSIDRMKSGCRRTALARDQGIALRELLPSDESLESVFAYLVET